VSETTPAPDQQADPPEATTPTDAIRSLGFDPDTVQALVLTPSSVVAIAVDYPEPHNPPEVPDGE